MTEYHSPNPYHRKDAWQEFKWDMRHPAELWRAVWAGMNGRNPELTNGERWLGFALIFVGLLQIMMGLAILL